MMSPSPFSLLPLEVLTTLLGWTDGNTMPLLNRRCWKLSCIRRRILLLRPPSNGGAIYTNRLPHCLSLIDRCPYLLWLNLQGQFVTSKDISNLCTKDVTRRLHGLILGECHADVQSLTLLMKFITPTIKYLDIRNCWGANISVVSVLRDAPFLEYISIGDSRGAPMVYFGDVLQALCGRPEVAADVDPSSCYINAYCNFYNTRKLHPSMKQLEEFKNPIAVKRQLDDMVELVWDSDDGEREEGSVYNEGATQKSQPNLMCDEYPPPIGVAVVSPTVEGNREDENEVQMNATVNNIRAPPLRALSAVQIHSIKDTSPLINVANTLEVLDLRGCYVDEFITEHVLSYLKNLRVLQLSGTKMTRTIDDSYPLLIAVMQSCHNLQILALHDFSYLSNQMITSLSLSLPNLQKLFLNGCNRGNIKRDSMMIRSSLHIEEVDNQSEMYSDGSCQLLQKEFEKRYLELQYKRRGEHKSGVVV